MPYYKVYITNKKKKKQVLGKVIADNHEQAIKLVQDRAAHNMARLANPHHPKDAWRQHQEWHEKNFSTFNSDLYWEGSDVQVAPILDPIISVDWDMIK